MPKPPSPTTLLVVLSSSLLHLATAASPALTDDSQCGCYLTNESSATFFTSHKFFDFRSLSQYAGVPATLQDPDSSSAASVTSPFFATAEWNASWAIQSWNTSVGGTGARGDATVARVNSPNNVYIERNADDSTSGNNQGGKGSTYLTLRTERMEEFQSSAELESASRGYHFVSVRMLARTVGGSGAVTALFTYRPGADANAADGGGGGGSGGGVQEADLEVLTRDPGNVVRCTNQPSVSPSGDVVANATVNATMPGGKTWGDWAVHRLDWTPARSVWFVDGTQVAGIAFQTPRDPAQVILNAWSDGGEWSGNMTVGDAAYLQIQWLEMVFNATGGNGEQEGDEEQGKGCRTVCSVDETGVTGKPVMLWSTSGVGRMHGRGLGVGGWVLMGLVWAAVLLL